MRGIGTNLDVLRPSDLSETPDVNGSKKGFVRERREHAAADIRREINDSGDAIGVSQADAEARKRFNFVWAIHGVKMIGGLAVRKRVHPNNDS